MVGEYEDFIIDTIFKVGADVLGGLLIEIEILLAPESLGASTFLIIGGLMLIAYGNDLFEDPYDPDNQFGFLLSLALSFSPQTNLAKFIIKPGYRVIVRFGFRSQGIKFVLKEVFFRKASINSIDNFITDLVQDQILNWEIYNDISKIGWGDYIVYLILLCIIIGIFSIIYAIISALGVFFFIVATFFIYTYLQFFVARSIGLIYKKV
ncbi:MAG: hypothetical protein ISP01_01425 [Methanobrevibacter arboriphilus]|uniref:Uncharacterized protein n=1 Tax=Methanobrevibacter arboriphilus TaxID=39441 RepID=A0A843ADN4_METAZ|nr:hypothetical protein [Methanobrevibacter arboriphilus]MBF4468043.1 hypothetical protein [Methanobrevibacter arboriphilus]